MDPFTQRMLERARARREKIDSKLVNNGQQVTPRKPLTVDNVLTASAVKSSVKNIKSPERKGSSLARRPSKDTCSPPPKRLSGESKTSTRRTSDRGRDGLTREVYTVGSPGKSDLREVCVTRTEYVDSDRSSDVALEINIMHRDDVQVQVQVQEGDAPIVVHTQQKAIQDAEYCNSNKENCASNNEPRSALRQNAKSRLDRLGVLYSDNSELSSPIHRTENEFTSATPPPHAAPAAPAPHARGKLPRLAALASTINSWEDDTQHHVKPKADSARKPVGTRRLSDKQSNKQTRSQAKREESQLDVSALDVSIHSFNDINRIVTANKASAKSPAKSRTSDQKSTCWKNRLNESTVAALEPSAHTRGRDVKMATAVAAAHPAVVKKPSIKKYKAPTPPRRVQSDENAVLTDSLNNLVNKEVNDNDATASDCKQKQNDEPIRTEEKTPSNRSSPIVNRSAIAPKLNGHNEDVEKSSVLSKAALFENGSPFQRDPTTMSIRERKALFEKNKGAAIVPKAPFGQAPSAKMLQAGKKETPKPVKPLTASTALSITKSPSKSSLSCKSREDLTREPGGIKGKLQALLHKEQTISEATIGEKNKKERQKELEMLQNRFHFKAKPPPQLEDSDSDVEVPDASERAPLMGSTVSLHPAARLEPPALRSKCKSETALHSPVRDEIDIVEAPKRRSSQDSPVVLSVLDDVKPIRSCPAPAQTGAGLYPRLADIHSAEEEDESCGSSTEDVSEKGKRNLNTSENWAETSFGRDIMQTMKRQAVSKPTVSFTHDTSGGTASSAADSELDDLLDEAIDMADSEAHTDKACTSLSSKSFTFRGGGGGSPLRTTVKCEFKSPLKTPRSPARARTAPDGKDQLVHSVSFYRRMQSATSQPVTPVRSVRHEGEQDEDSGETEREAAKSVRQRIAELQQEICKQQTVISQASQALNLCASTVEFSGSTEQAEGERLLLLATRSRQACLHELQRLQVEGAGPAAQPGAVSLTLTDISLALSRDYVRKLNADDAVGHHCVCVLQCCDKVLASSMQLTRADSTTLSFPDIVRVHSLPPDFKVTVEVYLLQASKELLPHEVKYHITNKKASSRLLTPKAKISELKTPRIQSPAGPSSVRSPRFQLHGYCIFALQQVKRTSFTLNKVPHGSPLEGAIGMRLSAKLSLPPPPPHAAFLTAFDDVSGLGAWHRRWYVLQQDRLAWWKYPDEVKKKAPMGDLDLAEVVSESVRRAPRDICARPHTLLLETEERAGARDSPGSLLRCVTPEGTALHRHLLAADTQEDRDAWLDVLNKALQYVRCNLRDDE